MPDRIPGCICELDPKTSEPVVLGYAMCPIHKPDVVTPRDTAKRLLEQYNLILCGLDTNQNTNKEISDIAKTCATSCAKEILAYYPYDQFQYYWNDVIREIENI